MSHLRFNVRVREAIDIHGCQVGAAFDAHTQSATRSLLGLALQIAVEVWREELKAEQQTTSLLQTPLLLRLPLKDRRETNRKMCVLHVLQGFWIKRRAVSSY